VGGTIQALDSLFDANDPTSAAFAAVRPPGHHASSDVSAGFCIFNNVAIAVKHAQAKHGLKKICIFDCDVHCGDGTSKILYQDDSVLYISLHRFDDGLFYPYEYGKY
jgi:histone deacetylase 6